MSSRFPSLILLLLCSLPTLAQRTLRICADPDNLPFSNRAGQGFDNRVATLVAEDMHRQPVFIWTRSRRGFLREQFDHQVCDVLVGVPLGMKGLAVTAPYYRSAYVFVTPAREHLAIASFADPVLNGRRIGLQILEENLSPASLPLIRAGHARQLVGFDSFGQQEGAVVRAVASGKVGAAVVWGPVAGYFAQRSHVRLTLTPVSPARDATGIPFAYSIGLGVHARDTALLGQLNAALTRLQPRLHGILAAFGIPLATEAP